MTGRDPDALAAASLHPPRAQILTAVTERQSASVREIAVRLGLPPRRVRHHLDLLLAAGLIEVSGERGGARRYRSDTFAFEDIDQMSPGLRAAIVRDIVRLLLRDIAVASAAGTFGTHPDDHMVRMYGEVDDACVDELADIHMRFYREMFTAMETGRARAAASDGSGIEIVSALFFFEAPIWGGVAPGRGDAEGSAPAPGRPARPAAVSVSPPTDPVAMATAHTHPVRSGILAALAERPGVSIREVAARVGESPRRVRHQIERLVADGLATVTGEELRGGVVERRYGAGSLLIEDTSPLSPALRSSHAREIVHFLLADVSAAEAAGAFGRHRYEFETRFYGVVDEDGLEALADIHRRAHPEIQRTIEAGRERLRESGGTGTEIVSALFLFEAPLWNGIRA